MRDENHIPHVDNPKEPRYIIGSEVDIRAIPIKLAENAERFKDPVGRKMRADAALLLAGVASFPRESANNDPELYKKWEELTVDYLKNKYGANLRAVLMHDDEEHPHLHFYVYSDIEVNAKMLHDGYKMVAIQPSTRRVARLFKTTTLKKWPAIAGWLDGAKTQAFNSGRVAF